MSSLPRASADTGAPGPRPSFGALDPASRAIASAAFLLGLYLYLGRLASSPLQTGNEAMYAYPPITMLESGDYLVPRFENGEFLEKPSPTWWPVVASYRVFGISFAAERLPGAVAAPGLFTMDYSGKGQAVAFNQNQQLNSAATPAARGSQLTLLVTGLGQTTPAGKDGHLAAAPLPAAALQPAVTIGGQPAAFVSATDVAGQIEGMMQITVQVPIAIQPANAVPVAVQVGGVSTPSGVTIAISQ